MKGIIMAGGKGTRLYPMTLAVNKSLLAVYDKPLIYYQVSVLIMAGVRDILIYGNENDLPLYEALLGDGRRFGVNIQFRVDERRGVPGALIEARDFIGDESIAVILGDNIFFGEELKTIVAAAAEKFEDTGGAMVFCHYAEDPRSFGVVEYDDGGKIISLESKPQVPKSNYAVTGLFFFENQGIRMAADTETDSEGMIILAAFLQKYLKQCRLQSVIFDEGIGWFDAGTPERLLNASVAVKKYQENHKEYAGCIEEEAARRGLTEAEQLKEMAQEMGGTKYGIHLSELAEEMATV